jgi:hypothetical protein
VDHAIEIERGLVADSVAAGARYIQFDFPLYVYVSDPTWRERFVERGSDLGEVMESALAADTAVMEGHSRGRHDCAPYLPEELPVVVDVRRLAGTGG